MELGWARSAATHTPGQGIHHAAGQALDGFLASAWIPQPVFQLPLEHADFKDADAAARTAKATAEIAGEAAECAGQAFNHNVNQ